MKKRDFYVNRSIAVIILLVFSAPAVMVSNGYLPTAEDTTAGVISEFYFLDILPQWLIFVLLIAVSLLAIEGGQRLGYWRSRKKQEAEGPTSTVVAAVLALLAFVIALTFSAAGSRFDERKQVLLEEVNAIGTAYLRAGLIPEPHSTSTRRLLREYVAIRLNLYRVMGREEKMLAIQNRTLAMQRAIWAQVTELVKDGNESPVTALFISSINDVFDMNTTRIVIGAEYRIPILVWFTLGLVSILAMGAVGYYFGIGGKRSIIPGIALSVSFALVILLIYDFDRPGEGFIIVNQQPMIELYKNLGQQK